MCQRRPSLGPRNLRTVRTRSISFWHCLSIPTTIYRISSRPSTNIASRRNARRFWTQEASPITGRSCAVALWSLRRSAFSYGRTQKEQAWGKERVSELGIVHSGQTAHWFFEKLPTSRGHTSFLPSSLSLFLPSYSFRFTSAGCYRSKHQKSFYSAYSHLRSRASGLFLCSLASSHTG